MNILRSRDHGCFVVRSNPWGHFLAPTSDPEGEPGLTLEVIKEFALSDNIHKLQPREWNAWISLCFHVADKIRNCEVSCRILRSAESPEIYRIIVPPQEVSGASAKMTTFDGSIDIVSGELIENYPPEGWIPVGSSHSHNTMPPTPSSTDNEYELADPGLHIIVGSISIRNNNYQPFVSVTAGGRRFKIDQNAIINFDVTVNATFHKDVLGNIKEAPRYNYTYNSTANTQYCNRRRSRKRRKQAERNRRRESRQNAYPQAWATRSEWVKSTFTSPKDVQDLLWAKFAEDHNLENLSNDQDESSRDLWKTNALDQFHSWLPKVMVGSLDSIISEIERAYIKDVDDIGYDDPFFFSSEYSGYELLEADLASEDDWQVELLTPREFMEWAIPSYTTDYANWIQSWYKKEKGIPDTGLYSWSIYNAAKDYIAKLISQPEFDENLPWQLAILKQTFMSQYEDFMADYLTNKKDLPLPQDFDFTIDQELSLTISPFLSEAIKEQCPDLESVPAEILGDYAMDSITFEEGESITYELVKRYIEDNIFSPEYESLTFVQEIVEAVANKLMQAHLALWNEANSAPLDSNEQFSSRHYLTSMFPSLADVPETFYKDYLDAGNRGHSVTLHALLDHVMTQINNPEPEYARTRVELRLRASMSYDLHKKRIYFTSAAKQALQTMVTGSQNPTPALPPATSNVISLPQKSESVDPGDKNDHCDIPLEAPVIPPSVPQHDVQRSMTPNAFEATLRNSPGHRTMIRVLTELATKTADQPDLDPSLAIKARLAIRMANEILRTQDQTSIPLLPAAK